MIGERLSLTPLIEEGLLTRARTLQLDRTEAGIHGQIDDASAEIERNQQAIGENEQQPLSHLRSCPDRWALPAPRICWKCGSCRTRYSATRVDSAPARAACSALSG